MTAATTDVRAGDSCRSCGRPLLWLRTGTGKAMPVDPEPVLGGNLIVDERRGTADAVHNEARDAARDRGELLHVSHFVTCTAPEQHRRRGR